MIAGQGADVFVLRTTIEGGPRWVAHVIQESEGRKKIVWVLNGGDGRNQHPTQTLLDLLTIKIRLGRLENFRIGFVGDLANGRTAMSLLQALRHYEGVEVVLVSPKGTELPAQYKIGLNIIRESESLDALSDCDVVYVTRFQLERIQDPILRREVQGKYIINAKVLNTWKKTVLIMHPLPSVAEIAPDIKNDPRLIAYNQADNGIPVRMGLLHRPCVAEFIPITRPAQVACLARNEEQQISNERKPVKHFQPIVDGTVIDHIPPGSATEVVRMLCQSGCLEGDRPRQLVQYVKSREYEGMKDVLLLHHLVIPDAIAATVQLFFPKITINQLPDNGTIVKKGYTYPKLVESVFPCPNAACVTNHDPEAKTIFVVSGDQRNLPILTCYYCERLFARETLTGSHHQ